MILLLLACAALHDKSDAGADTAAEAETGLRFSFPLDTPALFQQVIGVDHDPVVQEPGIAELQCTDYLGRAFPNCYDEHDGTDFVLKGGFAQMDEASPFVLAAAPGTVIAAEDGHYDRCHSDASIGDVSCDGYDGIANSVVMAHADGSRTLYWHLKEGSVAVTVGTVLDRGAVLGQVGSSGYSSMPHLHFEVQGADELPVDPYAGPHSQPESRWCEQGSPEGLPGPCPVDEDETNDD